jgi:hypothetical protein
LSIQSSRDFSKTERLEEIAESLAILGVKDYSFLAEQFPSETEIVGLLERSCLRSSRSSFSSRHRVRIMTNI